MSGNFTRTRKLIAARNTVYLVIRNGRWSGTSVRGVYRARSSAKRAVDRAPKEDRHNWFIVRKKVRA